MDVTFVNKPSAKAIRNAWQVVAEGLSEKYGVPLQVVEVKKDSNKKESKEVSL